MKLTENDYECDTGNQNMSFKCSIRLERKQVDMDKDTDGIIDRMGHNIKVTWRG